ncbi:hypothetical protein SDC9_196942 [bioreactor metagenome]|uniref:Uncharacterized protein n=1 Tax=bioreactor metagenome TaxID=1076179 RepID=A0A645ILY2_9ZZZZ
MGGLAVAFQQNFTTALAFAGRKNFGAGKQFNILWVNKGTRCGGHVVDVRQPALYGFGSPFGGVVVAIENDAAMLFPAAAH